MSNKETLNFVESNIEKRKFYFLKQPIDISDADNIHTVKSR